MTREEKIQALLDDIENWETDLLIAVVQDRMGLEYDRMNDDEINIEYFRYFEDWVGLEHTDEEPFPIFEECPNCGQEKDIGCKCCWCGVVT
jgi:hypothetical protein